MGLPLAPAWQWSSAEWLRPGVPKACLELEGMGYYSLFFVGVVYLLVSIASNEGATVFRLTTSIQHQVRARRYEGWDEWCECRFTN